MTFIRFTNRDTQASEYVNLDRIVRVCACQHPEHAGFALVILDLQDVAWPPADQPTPPARPMVVEADVTVEEFMASVQMALDLRSL